MKQLDFNYLLNEKKIEMDFNSIMLLWGASSAVTYLVIMLGEYLL